VAESAHTVAVSGWVGSSVLESVLRLGGGICLSLSLSCGICP